TKSAWGETAEETCAASDVTLIKTITERNRVIRDSWVGFGFSERERFRLECYRLVSRCPNPARTRAVRRLPASLWISNSFAGWLTSHRFNALPFVIGDRHHRQT